MVVISPLSQHRNVLNTNPGRRTLGMLDAQKFGRNSDTIDMIQNALEENNMDKATVYKWKKV